MKSERTDTPPKKEETTAKTETLLADCILKKAGPSPPQDREEESRAGLPAGTRATLPSPLREDQEEMIALDQGEERGASWSDRLIPK